MGGIELLRELALELLEDLCQDLDVIQVAVRILFHRLRARDEELPFVVGEALFGSVGDD